MTKLDEILTDLTAEGDALDAFVSTLTDVQWRAPTVAPGWDTATQIAHLAWTDELAVIAATDKVTWDEKVLEAIQDPTGYVDAEALRIARGSSTAEILDHWRNARPTLVTTLRGYPDGEKLPWFGPPMSPTSMATARFMET